MENHNYITIQGWMINELKLSGNELICYALIYGFSQDGETEFAGSRAYVADALNVTKANASSVLKRLTEKNLISKRDVFVNGVKFCRYRAIISEPVVSKQYRGGIETISGGGIETIPNNTNINNTIDKDNIVASAPSKKSTPKFDFKKGLIELGIEESVADDWIELRKKKKASNSQTSLNAIKNEIKKSGRGANECIVEAVSRGWQGFKAEWINKDKNGSYTQDVRRNYNIDKSPKNYHEKF